MKYAGMPMGMWTLFAPSFQKQLTAVLGYDGVMGVVNGKQVQVVVGGEVVPAYNEIMKNYSFGGGTAPAAPKQKEKLTAKSAFDALLDYISGTMVQIIPLFIGCGLVNCILSVAKIVFGVDSSTATYQVLNAVANAPFYYLPILVLFGAHTVRAPVMIESIGTAGFDALVRSAFIMASFGHVGASLAVTLKCKNKELKGMAAGVTLTSFLGTNEPSMYALEVPLVKPFIAALGGAFCGGVVSSLAGAKAYAVGKNGVFGWLVFEDTIVWIILASLVSAAVAFAFD